MSEYREPTSDECTNNAEVELREGVKGFAIWYPQMGGYTGRAVIVKRVPEDDEDACFDVYVWHDGEFPFVNGDEWRGRGDEGEPYVLHHCRAAQFISFGETVQRLTS